MHTLLNIVITAPLLLLLGSLIASALGWRAGRLDSDQTLYLSGVLITVVAIAATLHLYQYSGAGPMPGLCMGAATLGILRTLEILREYVPEDWPLGYTGG